MTRRHNIPLTVFLMACMLGFGVDQAKGQLLTSSGPCPGLMTFTVTGAAPFARVAFIHAANTGSWVVPPAFPCTGLVTGLAAPVVLGAWEEADGSGTASVSATIPAGVCGNRFLQAVDALLCTTTNVILIN